MSSGAKVLPFYVVVDTSASMQGCIDVLNQELPNLKNAVVKDPIVSELARFGVIAFSTDANQVLPLSDLFEVDVMPSLSAGGSTSYHSAFGLLGQLLPHDMEWFKREGMRPYRPVVFFITDGRPNRGESWEGSWQALTDRGFHYHPTIVAFGFGDVDDQTLARIATFKAFAARDGESPSSILSTISEALINSIIISSRNAAQGTQSFSMPANIDGMYEIQMDVL